jgi:hypothetical protein
VTCYFAAADTGVVTAGAESAWARLSKVDQKKQLLYQSDMSDTPNNDMLLVLLQTMSWSLLGLSLLGPA